MTFFQALSPRDIHTWILLVIGGLSIGYLGILSRSIAEDISVLRSYRKLDA